MDIGLYLKEIKKTKTELADDLGLSRPTLNFYIEQFEKGNKIENERYDIIFQRLFSGRLVNRELFERKIEAVKYLLERDRKYDIGLLNPESADLVAKIHNIMVNDLSTDDWNKKVYDTIIVFLTRYKNDTVFRELSGYFSDLNSDSDLSDISDLTKAYYSYFYMCFRKIVREHPSFDVENYNAFLERRTQLSIERAKSNALKSENIKVLINKKLKEVENEFLEKGIEASEDDMLAELVRRVQG